MSNKTNIKYELEFHWLYYSNRKNGYICKYCEVFSGTVCHSGKEQLAFIDYGVALGDHPRRKLNKHEESTRHNKSAERISDSKSKKSASARSGGVLRALVNFAEDKKEENRISNREHLKKVFQTTNFMIKKRLAISVNLEQFVRFMAELGVPDLQRLLNIDDRKGTVTYLSSFSVKEIVECINAHIEIRVLDSLRTVKYFTVLLDESTDEANREQFAIFGKWSTDGYVSEHFLGLVKVTKTDAANLLNCLEQFSVAKNIDLSKARFIGLDGCNVMSGEVSGNY